MISALQTPVLVLNRFWQVVNICTAKRALVLLYSGHAQVVFGEGQDYATYDFSSWRDFSQLRSESFVRSPSGSLCVPSVIVLVWFQRLPKKEVKFTRQNVFLRDGNRCQYCGEVFQRQDLNLDHVVPRARGGKLCWENVVCSCIPCNGRKANRLPSEAGMRLLRVPKPPKPMLGGLGRHGALSHIAEVPVSWRRFVDLAYWNVELGD